MRNVKIINQKVTKATIRQGFEKQARQKCIFLNRTCIKNVVEKKFIYSENVCKNNLEN